MADVTLKYTKLSIDPDESHMLGLSLLPPASRVLEVGAATGYVTAEMLRRGFDVVAVEINPAAAAVAVGLGLPVRTGTVETTLGADEFFDAVLLMDVAEHIVEVDDLFATCVKHLRPGGAVVISVPNIAHWRMRMSLLRGRFDYTRSGTMDDTHVRFYTRSSLEQLLTRHGLVVTERKGSIGLGTYPMLNTDEKKWQGRKMLRRAVARWPESFAYQFIFKALLP